MQVYGRFAGIYDALMGDVDREKWSDYLLSFVTKENASIVDVACGTGEFSWRFAKQGYNTVGIDMSEDMLFVASEKARANGVFVPFVCQDMRELKLHKRVDVISCACDGVNYLQNDEDAESFFKAAFDNLKRNGIFMFDVSSAYKLENILSCNTFAAEEENCAYIWNNMYDDESKLIRMDVTFFERKKEQDVYERFSETHIQRAYTQSELYALLKKAGFEKIKVYEAFTNSEPEENSERLQFVAYKSEEE